MKYLLDETTLTGIADAIRSKLDVTTKFKPIEMAEAIEEIKGGGTGGCPVLMPYGVLSGEGWYLNTSGVLLQDSSDPDCVIDVFKVKANRTYAFCFGNDKVGNRCTVAFTTEDIYAEPKTLPMTLKFATSSSLAKAYNTQTIFGVTEDGFIVAYVANNKGPDIKSYLIDITDVMTGGGGEPIDLTRNILDMTKCHLVTVSTGSDDVWSFKATAKNISVDSGNGSEWTEPCLQSGNSNSNFICVFDDELGGITRGDHRYLCFDLEVPSGQAGSWNLFTIGAIKVSTGRPMTQYGITADISETMINYSTQKNYDGSTPWYNLPRQTVKLDISSFGKDEPFWPAAHACSNASKIYKIWLE